jgi:hypothetical protein
MHAQVRNYFSRIQSKRIRLTYITSTIILVYPDVSYLQHTYTYFKYLYSKGKSYNCITCLNSKYQLDNITTGQSHANHNTTHWESDGLYIFITARVRPCDVFVRDMSSSNVIFTTSHRQSAHRFKYWHRWWLKPTNFSPEAIVQRTGERTSQVILQLG